MSKRFLLFFYIVLFSTQFSYTKYDNNSYKKEPLTTTHVVNQARSADVEYVQVYFTDISGSLHGLIIPFSQFESALLDGLKFDGSSIPGYTNIYDSDMHLSLDYESFFVHPAVKNQPQVARIFANVQQSAGIPYSGDPRYLLQEKIKQAELSGHTIHLGAEIEFFLLEKNSSGEYQPWDKGAYFDVEYNQKHETIHFEIMETLIGHGINIEKLHHEVAPGQHEFSIRYNTPIKMADQIMLAKYLVKKIANKHGLLATFMPKPFCGMNGSGMHIHFSVADSNSGWNLFYDPDEPSRLSPLAQRFIAGVLKYVTPATLILNNNVNSFKRLVPGYEAPVYVCWSLKNRSALIRIPMVNESQPEATRAEIRCPDPLCNPYSAFTFIISAGMIGIERDLPIEHAQEDNLFKLSAAELIKRDIKTLPASFKDALYQFEHVGYLEMCDLFNYQFVEEFIKIKKEEAFFFDTSITNLEFTKYL